MDYPQGSMNISGAWRGSNITLRMLTEEEIAQNEIQKQKEVESQIILDKKWEEYIEKYSFSETFSQYLRTGVTLMKKIHYTESFLKNAVEFNVRNEEIDQNQLARGVTKYLTNYHFISDNAEFMKLFWECINQFNHLDFDGGCKRHLCRFGLSQHDKSVQSKYYQKLWWSYYALFQRIFFEDVTEEMLDEDMFKLEKYFKKLETDDHFKNLATIKESFRNKENES